MDTFSAMLRGMSSHGKTPKVFDWDRAAELIKEHGCTQAVAGLASDMSYTSGVIYSEGQIVDDSCTYLASTWATPVLVLDGKTCDCYIMGDQTDWNESTVWPNSARKIVSAK